MAAASQPAISSPTRANPDWTNAARARPAASRPQRTLLPETRTRDTILGEHGPTEPCSFGSLDIVANIPTGVYQVVLIEARQFAGGQGGFYKTREHYAIAIGTAPRASGGEAAKGSTASWVWLAAAVAGGVSVPSSRAGSRSEQAIGVVSANRTAKVANRSAFATASLSCPRIAVKVNRWG